MIEKKVDRGRGCLTVREHPLNRNFYVFIVDIAVETCFTCHYTGIFAICRFIVKLQEWTKRSQVLSTRTGGGGC